jgi:protein-disulfide isomerase
MSGPPGIPTPAQPVDPAVDHVRGADPPGVTLLVYGDYECPYTRMAVRNVQRVERELPELRFVFRHFPLTAIHPHALHASAAAEAAAAQDAYWPMHDRLFARQKALEDDDLRGYAVELGLDPERFDADRRSEPVAERIARDVRSGEDSGVAGTPTLFVDDALHTGSYDEAELLAVLRRRIP